MPYADIIVVGACFDKGDNHMVNETSFVVRISGRKENSYYIDYLGNYKLSDVSRLVGIKQQLAKEIYTQNGAVCDQENDVYYFSSIAGAKKAISEMLNEMKPEKRGKVVFLTNVEIEYIRKALINEGVNSIHVSNKLKDAIFYKLNG